MGQGGLGFELKSLQSPHSFAYSGGGALFSLTTMQRAKYQSHVSARGERNELSVDGWGEEIEVISKSLSLFAACLLFPGVTENKFPKNFLLLRLDTRGQEY